MAISPPKPYCHTNKRQMYAFSPPKPYFHTNKRHIYAVSPSKLYCHTDKRQMYGSQSTQAHPIEIHLSIIFGFLKCLPFYIYLTDSLFIQRNLI